MDSHLRYAHEEWPTKFFDVDLTSDMLGSVKPYYRQVGRFHVHPVNEVIESIFPIGCDIDGEE